MDALGMVNALIGVVTVYFVLSLVVTAVLEWWMQLLGIRGEILQQLVASLFGDDSASRTSWRKTLARFKNRALTLVGRTYDPVLELADRGQRVKAFFAHDRIKALCETDGRLPSYVDEQTMTEVLVEVQINQNAAAPLRLADLRGAPTQLRALLDRDTHDPLGRILRDLLVTANGDPERFLEATQKWVHEVGQRATGWLRRRIMPSMFAMSLLLAIVANADTVRIFQRLTADGELAAQVVEKARQMSDGAASFEEQVCSGDTKVANADPGQCASLQYARRVALDVAPLLGWAGDPLALGVGVNSGTASLLGTLSLVLSKLLGVLITAFALLLGAPFWFDVLQRLMKVRSSLRPGGNGSGSAADGSGPGGPAPDGTDRGAAPASPKSPAGAPTAPADPDKLPFNGVASRFDVATALWLSRVADAAYLDTRQAMETSLGGSFLAPYDELDASRSHTQFAILTRPDVVVLAFRGTEALPADWHTDARCKFEPASWGAKRHVHVGFHDALDAVWVRLCDELRKALATPRPLWITGHSLGGALAALAAHRLLTEENVAVAGLCTFGQPACGDEHFCRDLDGHLAGRYWRVVNHRDPVPRVPTKRQGYSHGGTLLYFDSFGRLVTDPAWWLRNLDMLALPTDRAELEAVLKAAVADHSLYTELLFKSLSATARQAPGAGTSGA